jgi:hypothetical protein
MKLQPRPSRKLSVKLKGWLQTPIQYEDRLGDKKWSDFFGHYQNQRWDWFDTSSCWCLAPINSAEDQLEWLNKNNMFSKEALHFFTSNGYIDFDEDFSLSERYLEIKGGNKTNGGTAEEGEQLIQKPGCIPREMLTYSLEQLQERSQYFNGDFQAVVNDYFNSKYITPQMDALADQFRKYVNVAYQIIGKKYTTPNINILKAALKQAPLCIGIPTPLDVSLWNSSFVQYDGGKVPSHEVELYDINDKGQYLIFDQYEPHLKTLSADYYIPFCTQLILYAVPQSAANPNPQDSWWNIFWTAVMNWWNGIPNSTPIGHT